MSISAFIRRLEERWARRYVTATQPDGAADAEGRSPVVVITGGTEGIGRSLAAEFARAGHDLLLVARTEQALGAAAKELQQKFGVKVHVVQADIARADGCDKVSDTLEALNLYADILVNNAGEGLCGPFEDHGHEELMHLIDLNMRALSDLMHRFLPGMLVRARGGILNVASLGGALPGPYQAAYYASKAYVISLTEAVAHEIAGRGVRMSVLVPGPVATNFHARMGAGKAFYMRFFGRLAPDVVGRAGYTGFRCGKTVIIPGLLSTFNYYAVRLVPHFILLPFMGILLKRR